MTREWSDQSFGWVANSFLVGGVIGAITALLLAPRSGKETREQIKRITESARETTNDYYGRVKRTATSALQSGERFLKEKSEGTAKATRGDRYACEACGLVVSVDEECGCAEAHNIMCCGEEMEVKK